MTCSNRPTYKLASNFSSSICLCTSPALFVHHSFVPCECKVVCTLFFTLQYLSHYETMVVLHPTLIHETKFLLYLLRCVSLGPVWLSFFWQIRNRSNSSMGFMNLCLLFGFPLIFPRTVNIKSLRYSEWSIPNGPRFVDFTPESM